MEILKIIQALQSYTEDAVAYKLDGNFAHAVTEAVNLLVSQGERIADLESTIIQQPKKRLIDLDAIKPMNFPSTEMDGLDVVRYLNTLPTVEVVLCKDCIHWYEPDGVCLKIYSDGAASRDAWQDRNEDDFCSYGERKTE